MNLRQRSLLTYLLVSQQYKKISVYCMMLNCSEKTIRNDIKMINAFLSTHQFKTCIISKQGTGIKLRLLAYEEEYLSYFLDTNLLEIIPDLDRFYQGMIALLFHPETYCVETLAEVLFTNPEQIKKDFVRWSSMLETFHLKLERKKYLKITGKEAHIRLFVVYYFYHMAEKAMMMKIEPLFLKNDQAFFQTLLKAIEKLQELSYTTNALHQLELYISIMVQRISLGHQIADKHKTSIYAYEGIKKMLQEHFAISISDGELLYLKEMCDNAAKKWSSHLFRDYHVSRQAKKITEQFLMILEATYVDKVSSTLKETLLVLFETAFRRKASDMLILNYEGNEIKAAYLKEFIMVMKIFYEDTLLNHSYFNDMEYTRFTMALLPYFDLLDVKKKYKAGLIVNCSIEQVFFAVYKIEQYIPKVSIVHTLIEEEVSQYEPYVDFFITFTYIKSSKPFVLLSNVINEKDLHKLGSFIRDFTKLKMQDDRHPIPEYHKVLPRVSYQAMLQYIYHDLMKEACISFHQQEFLKRFALQKVFSNHQIILVFYDAFIGYEALIYYHLKEGVYCDGFLISEIRVLCMKELDDYQLQKIMDKNDNMSA